MPAAALNVISFVVIWVAITMVGVATLSLMLDTVGRRTATTLRTIYFLPGAVTTSAVVVLWLFLLDPGVSPFQSLLHAAGWTYSIDVISGIGLAGVFALMAIWEFVLPRRKQTNRRGWRWPNNLGVEAVEEAAEIGDEAEALGRDRASRDRAVHVLGTLDLAVLVHVEVVEMPDDF